MKKTLTVNLGGTVYHIDEDAYNLLDNYLNNLRYHFRKEEGADEIVRDMETRIAELFDEYIRIGQQVITIEQVEAVIARMGKPEELNTDDNDEKKEEKTNHTYGNGTARRLFRNPDDRILGGVLSGLSAYFGWDTYWSTGSRMFCPGIDSGLSDCMDYCSAGKNSNGKVTDAW